MSAEIAPVSSVRVRPGQRYFDNPLDHSTGQAPSGNLLLAALPPEERSRVEECSEVVSLEQDAVLARPGGVIEYLYFPLGGLGCELGSRNSSDQMELRCFGREGLTGWPLLIGDPVAPHLSLCATSMVATRVPRSDLQEMMRGRPHLRDALLGYLRDVMLDIADAALDAARCTIEHRLARWLLLKYDRLEGVDLPFTHAFIARGLGVRRAGITNALHILEGEHLIIARRGHIVVRDREGLQRVARNGLQALYRPTA
jgi:CRP-like cAMP-binding protein